jgi:hypothetical protein
MAFMEFTRILPENETVSGPSIQITPSISGIDPWSLESIFTLTPTVICRWRNRPPPERLLAVYSGV